jgi:hypothetical protein
MTSESFFNVLYQLAIFLSVVALGMTFFHLYSGEKEQES